MCLHLLHGSLHMELDLSIVHAHALLHISAQHSNHRPMHSAVYRVRIVFLSQSQARQADELLRWRLPMSSETGPRHGARRRADAQSTEQRRDSAGAQVQ